MQQGVTDSRAIKVCIDHHLEPAPFAQHYLIDDQATSTGELTYRLLASMDHKTFDPTVAQALYCAILTDTGSFRYSHVDPEIHRIAAHLIECGVDPEDVYDQVYSQWTPGRIQLLGETLAGLTTACDGKLASITVTREMLQRTGTIESDTDNFTTYPMSVLGVKAGLLFLELEDGVKISFRSRGEIPINELAKLFGGNGHRNAAGARVDKRNLNDVKRDVIAAAKPFLLIPSDRT
jgi:phosphoesterase RecJ-like protein